jgi:hypothetical protein
MQLVPKPVRYAVCQEETSVGLNEAVNRYMSQGYQPHGDLHVVKISEQTTYVQAMVKVEFRPLEVPAGLGGGLLVPQ